MPDAVKQPRELTLSDGGNFEIGGAAPATLVVNVPTVSSKHTSITISAPSATTPSFFNLNPNQAEVAHAALVRVVIVPTIVWGTIRMLQLTVCTNPHSSKWKPKCTGGDAAGVVGARLPLNFICNLSSSACRGLRASVQTSAEFSSPVRSALMVTMVYSDEIMGTSTTSTARALPPASCCELKRTVNEASETRRRTRTEEW